MQLIIVGGSTHGLTARAVAHRLSRYSSIIFCDDRDPAQLPSSIRSSYLGKTEALEGLGSQQFEIFIAIGNNSHRRRITETLHRFGISDYLTSLIDPQATLMGDVDVESGTLIMPGAIVGPESRLGASSIIGAHVFVGAACSIGAFSNICPATCLGASTSIGEETYIGMGARIIQGLSIATGATVGAGAVVTNSIPCAGRFVGIPARMIATTS